MRFYQIIAGLALMTLCRSAQCQNEAVRAFKRCTSRTINFEQGLINNSTASAITDATGLTWVSTLSGIQRFNGLALEKITPVVDGDTLPINYAVYFLAEKNGSILIGYKKGVLEYSSITNSFKRKISVDPFSNLHYSLMPIKETDEGLWCLEEHKGLIIYNSKGPSSNFFSSSEISNADSLINSRDMLFKTIVVSNDDFVFMLSSQNKILQVSLRTHEFKYISGIKNEILGLACNKTRLYMTSVAGLSCINIYDGSMAGDFSFKTLINDDVNLSNIQIKNENKLLVTAGKRVYQFDSACRFVTEFTSLNRETFVSTGYIFKIYEDELKRIWLITNDDIKRIEDTDIPFGYFLYPKEKNNFVRAIYFDEEKKILFAGCYNGGIQLYDTLGNALWDRPLINNEVKDVLFIEKLSANDYLIITLNNGWYILNPGTKKLKQFGLHFSNDFRQFMESNNFSNSIQRIDDSTIMVSSTFNVFQLKLQNGTVKSVEPILKSPGFFYPINCFLYTHDKALWIGNPKGSLHRVWQNGDIKSINIPDNYIVRCLMEDANHNIWAGSEKGIFIYSPRGELIKQITKESGMRNDFVYALLPVDSNAVFASTNLGLCFISKEGIIRNYTKEAGLQENEFNTQAAIKTSSGKLYFGGVNGITTFYPKALSSISDSAIINITKLVVNDSLYNSSAGSWKGDTIHLKYSQNHLQLDILAMGLLDPNEYAYHYRLKSFEELWQTSHEPTALRYTLEPGEYLLEISCSPLLSPENISSKKIVIIIDPPWWQRWWFRLIAFAVLIASIVAIVLQYNDQKYQKKIRSLQIQNEIQSERERISKELHDNIGTQLSYISSNVDWVLDAPIPLSKEEEKKRLSVVNSTAKEMISDLRETIWAIKKESIQLEELADKLKTFIQSQRILKPAMEIDFSEDIVSNIKFSPTEALNIFRICQEAIVNCIRHSGAAKLSVVIQSDIKNNFSVLIEDNGKGFVQNKQYNGHYGLENMRSRAAELGTKLDIVSGEGKGTKIFLDRQKS